MSHPREEAIRKMLTGQHFMHHLGFEITGIEDGLVVGEMRLHEFAFQHFGRVHGGVILTAADLVMGFAAYTRAPQEAKVVTLDLHQNFLAPGQGEKLQAFGKVLKTGSRIIYCEAEIFTFHEGQKVLVGKASSNMAVLL